MTRKQILRLSQWPLTKHWRGANASLHRTGHMIIISQTRETQSSPRLRSITYPAYFCETRRKRFFLVNSRKCWWQWRKRRSGGLKVPGLDKFKPSRTLCELGQHSICAEKLIKVSNLKAHDLALCVCLLKARKTNSKKRARVSWLSKTSPSRMIYVENTIPAPRSHMRKNLDIDVNPMRSFLSIHSADMQDFKRVFKINNLWSS